MNLDWKKIGLIALFIAATILFAFFLYYFFFRPIFYPQVPDANINQPTDSGALPTSININGRIVTINTNGQLPAGLNVNDDIASQLAALTGQKPTTPTEIFVSARTGFSTTLSNGNIIYYDTSDGRFYQISTDGTVSAYDNKVFHNLKNVTWSGDRRRAVLEYPDGSNIVYDFASQQQLTLPKHWEDFYFAPDSQQISFKSIGLDIENRFLAVARYDGSGARTIENIGGSEDQFEANWSPNDQIVATFTDYKSYNRSEVYFIGLNNENFKSAIVEGRGFEGQWSPQGEKLLYSAYNSSSDYKPELWVASAAPGSIGNVRRRLDIQTWSNKCSFSNNDTIFCAVPSSLPFGAGIDQEAADNSTDDIYEINLVTGVKRLIATPEGSHTISQVITTNNPNQLFFVDQDNNRIYRIDL